MTATPSVGFALLLLATVACSDDKAAPITSTTSAVPPTSCATTPAPDGRLVSVTLDDVVAGFGSLGLRADDGLTPGIVRIELIGDAENASPVGVAILLDSSPVATIDGVGPGETCGIDVEVSEGVYHITDGDRDVEFTVGP